MKKRIVRGCLCCLVLSLLSVLFSNFYSYAEDIQITTYYPSPFGIYQDLQSSRALAVGDVNNDGSINTADLPGGTGNIAAEGLIAGRAAVGDYNGDGSLDAGDLGPAGTLGTSGRITTTTGLSMPLSGSLNIGGYYFSSTGGPAGGGLGIYSPSGRNGIICQNANFQIDNDLFVREDLYVDGGLQISGDFNGVGANNPTLKVGSAQLYDHPGGALVIQSGSAVLFMNDGGTIDARSGFYSSKGATVSGFIGSSTWGLLVHELAEFLKDVNINRNLTVTRNITARDIRVNDDVRVADDLVVGGSVNANTANIGGQLFATRIGSSMGISSGGSISGRSLSTGGSIRGGSLSISGTKNFVIPHPTKPGMELVHSTVEGPEAAVFYRGESRLSKGEKLIELPDYFEALTREEGRTVQLTPKGKNPFLLSYSQIKEGKFWVYGTEPEGEFSWEVKAVRADVDKLVVERPKQEEEPLRFDEPEEED